MTGQIRAQAERRARAAAWFATCGAVAGSLLTLAAGMALGAEEAAGHGEATPWLDLLWKTVNFVVLIAILVYFGRRPIGNWLGGAARQARTSLEETREAARQAEADLAEQKDKMANLQAELERMASEARANAQAERDRLIEQARADAERLREQARQQIEAEFRQARLQLKRELADEMTRHAESLIRERMTAQTQDKLVTDYIDALGARR